MEQKRKEQYEAPRAERFPLMNSLDLLIRFSVEGDFGDIEEANGEI
jgi:hypothetical protein